jgi:hypothetical protein
MKDTSKQPALAALRHLLTVTGGIAITHGYMTQSQATELAGVIPLIAGPLWDMADEWLTARQVQDDERLNLAVAAAVSKALADQKSLPASGAHASATLPAT